MFGGSPLQEKEYSKISDFVRLCHAVQEILLIAATFCLTYLLTFNSVALSTPFLNFSSIQLTFGIAL
eukprot:scaffold189179_cov17-Prasinocladus_malaysianus.AAC.1